MKNWQCFNIYQLDVMCRLKKRRVDNRTGIRKKNRNKRNKQN